ncbi:MAG TPA: Ig-like domain-containing protein [Gemmatimonadaceae bacterium]|jgi:Bacterial Ig-like domain (group 2).
MRRILSILAAGTLALSACSDDTVGPPVNYVFVVIPDSAQLSMSQDDSVTMNAIVEDTISGGRMYNADLDWSSDDPDVAVAEKNDDGDWQIRATGDGQTQIHIVFNAYHGPVEGTIDVSVTGVPAATFTVGDNDVALYPGDADTIRVTVKDADGNELSPHRVAWENSADSVASVEPLTRVWTDTITVGEEDSVVVDSVTYYAVVTANDTGSTEITATVGDMVHTIDVSVTPRPVATVEMSPDVAALHVGEKVTITATPKGANGEALTGRDILWGTSNATVATVDTAGVVTAVGAGNANIIAIVEGKIGTTAVLVVDDN